MASVRQQSPLCLARRVVMALIPKSSLCLAWTLLAAMAAAVASCLVQASCLAWTLLAVAMASLSPLSLMISNNRTEVR